MDSEVVVVVVGGGGESGLVFCVGETEAEAEAVLSMLWISKLLR